MTIKQRILWSLVIPSLFTFFGAFYVNHLLNEASSNYERIVSRELPLHEALALVELGVIRVVASTSEYGFIAAEQDHLAADTTHLVLDLDTAKVEETELVEEGEATLTKALDHFQRLLADEAAGDDWDIAEHQHLEASITRLVDLSRQIIAAKKQGLSGAPILQLKESFETAERVVVASGKRLHDHLKGRSEAHQQAAHSALGLLHVALFVLPVLLIAILGVTGWVLLVHLVRPLRKLERVVQRVRAGEVDAVGELDIRRKDEIGLFNEAFHDLIAEQHQSQQLTRAAQQRAEQATRAKSEFLANMSHEIRTPMNAVMGMSRLVLKTDLTERQRNYLEKVYLSAESLLGVINDILDFSKVEAGKLSLESVPFRLEDVLEHLQHMLAFRAEEAGIRFALEVDPAVPTALVGDPLRLGQILLNLGNNAIKFTEYDGSVTLRVEPLEITPDRVDLHLLVEDTGIGISPEQQETLFQPFNQADTSTTRRFGGTGLGLTICHRLADLMGGTLWVESELGVGSRFHFRVVLPRQQGEPSARASAIVLDSQQLEQQEAYLRGCRLLLVEDNKLNQEVAVDILQDCGIAVEIANNGQEALDRLDTQDFDGVLMDCQMPVMDGFEATRRIRAQARFRDLPIIAMTANALARDRERVLQAGMNDHVAKPVDFETLISTLARWVRRDGEVPVPAVPEQPEPPVDGSAPDLPVLPGIDRQEGLGLFNGRVDRFTKYLGLFAQTQARFPDQLREALQRGDLKAASRLAHTLKGGAASLAMPALRAAAERLELACAEAQPEAERKAARASALVELERVLTGLRKQGLAEPD